MMPKTFIIRSLFPALAVLATASASAQVVNSDAYLIDQRGAVARSGHGLCWRTAEWTPAKAIAECDPDLVKKPEPAPAPVAAAPAPAPQPAPAPAPAPVPKCMFGAALQGDTTFAFGKDTLTDEAKGQLDAMVRDTASRCGSVSKVTVVGHTDRIGSASGNMRLSEKRANAVAAYLQSKGLNASKFAVSGVGLTQPLPNVNCGKKLSKAKLHDCLAPNRRVTIDIQGVDK